MRALLRRWPLAVVALLAAAMMLVVACGGEEEGKEGTPGGTPKATAQVEVQGITDTEIRVGTLLPLSGPMAAWGVPLSKGMQIYYDYINDHGGIYGRKIKLIVGDSGYEGPMAKEAATKIVEQDKVFAFQGNLGTASELAVYKYLEENNIIDYAILTGASYWTNPVTPTRFVGLVNYITEGHIFGEYIAKDLSAEKVGILAQNDDYGKEGEQGIKQGLEDNGFEGDVVVEYYEAVETDMTAHVQRLKNEGVDVIVAFTGVPQVANAMKVARTQLNWDVLFIMSSTCNAEITATLAGFDNIEGNLTGAFGRQSWETDASPFLAWLEDYVNAKYGGGEKWGAYIYGGMLVSIGFSMAVRQAGEDLTVDSFIRAAEAPCDWVTSTGLPGVATTLGPTDHNGAEAEKMAEATIDRSADPATFRWVPFGETYTFETTKECKPPTKPDGYDDQPGPSMYSEEVPPTD
jgi:branched-chain amino acid transport system substrate-binding protein